MKIPRLALDALPQVFHEAEKPASHFRIGAESEKFGVHGETGRPLGYGGDFSVCQVLTSLADNFGWDALRETPGTPVLGLKRGGASVTLEPSVQLELSGDALEDLHRVHDEMQQHLAEIRPVTEEMGLRWLSTGFHPLCKLEDLDWVPKRRYPIMREYLPSQGSGGLDMMQRTATTQGNFDWSSEEDGMRKLQVALRLSPLIHAWFANAPFKEGTVPGPLSLRGHVWRHMDPRRSGLIQRVWEAREPRYEDYVSWALEAGMFLIIRDGQIVKNTGQSFIDFMKNGFEGHQATLEDWKLHLTSLFPEVRLKNTLEVRSVDALPPPLYLASLAVWTGILYDGQALDQVHALTQEWSFDQIEAERPALCDRGLHGTLAGRLAFEWAEQILPIAEAGLRRRAHSSDAHPDESHFLAPAQEILESRKLPAERALDKVAAGATLIEATAIPYPPWGSGDARTS